MITDLSTDGRALVDDVRIAAQAHNATWEALVPSCFEVNLDAEDAEEEAFAAMARAKGHLRKHICETYGISIRELASLAMP